MARNEDGEFELVVGNKQLLSIVFIVMVLFGVVFSMGYFVGRANSGSSEPPAEQVGNQAQGRPAAVGAQSTATPPAGETPLELGEAKVTTPETASASSSAPAETPAPPAATPTPAPPPPAKTPVAAPPSGGLPRGQTFLQVAAVGKPQAEMLVDVLRGKGFHALIAPVAPDSQIYRTLVGPIADAAELASTKVKLESAGFKPIVKRY
jgi:cell division septation protein DedD